MAHEILGFRKADAGKTKVKHFGKCKSIEWLFKNTETVLKSIPQEERFNIYYSVADVIPQTQRHKGQQCFVPFDIDHVDHGTEKEVVQIACEVLGVEYENVLSICSGYGVQILVKLKEYISSENYENGYFNAHRSGYSAICKEIKKQLEAKGFNGEPDPSVWKATQVMRLPNTLNKKEGRPDRPAFIINDTCEEVEFDFFMYGEAELESNSNYASQSPYANKAFLEHFDPPDIDSVIEGCETIKNFIASKGNISEPLWRAMASIYRHFPNGRDMFHQISSGYPNYSVKETDDYLDRASKYGPYRCDTIESLGGNCDTCPNKGKVKCPIQIKKKAEIGFQDAKIKNFRQIIVDKNGGERPGGVAYEALLDALVKEKNIITIKQSKQKYAFTGTQYKEITNQEIQEFCYNHVKPMAMNSERLEFNNLVDITNLRPIDFFTNIRPGLINCANGVVDTKNDRLLAHSKALPFLYTLPYNYDPEATCPRFSQFLDEITLGDKELQDIMMEFMGYAITNSDVIHHKAMIFIGDGSNGKGTFIEVMKKIFGLENISSLTMKMLDDETSRLALQHSLLNIGDENEKDVGVTEMFKHVVAGGRVPVKKLYCDKFDLTVRTKFVFACNQLPQVGDLSFGYFRRMLIIPFEAVFLEHQMDKELGYKLEKELPGILNLIIKGYKRLVNQRGFTESKRSKEMLEKYQESINSTLRWINEVNFKQTGNNNDFLPSKTMYESYRKHCKDCGDTPKSEKAFHVELRRQFPGLDGAKTRKISGQMKVRGFTGFVMDHFNPILGDYKFQSVTNGLVDTRYDS